MFLEILKNISSPWQDVYIYDLTMTLSNGSQAKLSKRVEFGTRILYPFCQRINIFELFSLQHLSIKKLMMKISVNRDENIGVTLFLEETNKVSFRSSLSFFKLFIQRKTRTILVKFIQPMSTKILVNVMKIL